eukprot:gene10573-13413_t
MTRTHATGVQDPAWPWPRLPHPWLPENASSSCPWGPPHTGASHALSAAASMRSTVAFCNAGVSSGGTLVASFTSQT